MGSEVEEMETEILDAATAARTVEELEAEIADLGHLEVLAEQVYRSGMDRKWEELARLLQNTPEMLDAEGRRQKLIIFTEHRDTLEYLERKLASLLGRPSAVAIIHGGVKREERRKVQDRFTQDADVTILVATDAAGEGLNLQRGSPDGELRPALEPQPHRATFRAYSPHRPVQHLPPLEPGGFEDTREGMVFERLLTKLEEQRRALGGKVFDVLGEAFSDRSLRDLLIDAIRSEDPRAAEKAHGDRYRRVRRCPDAGIDRCSVVAYRRPRAGPYGENTGRHGARACAQASTWVRAQFLPGRVRAPRRPGRWA